MKKVPNILKEIIDFYVVKLKLTFSFYKYQNHIQSETDKYIINFWLEVF